MKWIVLTLGVICFLLGGLWLLQGLGVVHLPPILCVADCEPIEGPSQTWTITGLVTGFVGVLAIAYAVKRLRRS